MTQAIISAEPKGTLDPVASKEHPPGSAPTAPATQRRRVLELDALRGVGALIVVWAHVRREDVFWAWTLMEMFFVLSATLLTSIVWGRIRTGKEVVRFYLRRAERIWPSYMVTVAALTILCFMFMSIGDSGKLDPFLAWRYLSFSQYSEHIFYSDPSFNYWFFAINLWSLAIEEQFYILLPALCLLTLRLRKAWQLGALSMLFFSGLWLRMSGGHYYAITTHVDGFILGAMIALALPWLRDHLSIARAIFAIAMALASLVLAHYVWLGYFNYFTADIDPYVYDPSAGAASVIFWGAAIGWLILHSGAQQFAWMRHPLLGYFGRISYPLYLVHYPILRTAPRIFNWLARQMELGEIPNWVCMGLGLALSCLAAHLLYVKVDKPLQERVWRARKSISPILSPQADSGA